MCRIHSLFEYSRPNIHSNRIIFDTNKRIFVLALYEIYLFDLFIAQGLFCSLHSETILNEITALKWKTIIKLINILHPFQMETILLSSKTLPSASIINPLIKSLLKNHVTELKRMFEVNTRIVAIGDMKINRG